MMRDMPPRRARNEAERAADATTLDHRHSADDLGEDAAGDHGGRKPARPGWNRIRDPCGGARSMPPRPASRNSGVAIPTPRCRRTCANSIPDRAAASRYHARMDSPPAPAKAPIIPCARCGCSCVAIAACSAPGCALALSSAASLSLPVAFRTMIDEGFRSGSAGDIDRAFLLLFVWSRWHWRSRPPPASSSSPARRTRGRRPAHPVVCAPHQPRCRLPRPHRAANWSRGLTADVGELIRKHRRQQ